MPYIKKEEATNMKRQICAMFNNNEDWKVLYTTLGVKKSTAYRWVKSQQEIAKQRSIIKRIKVTNDHKEYMEQCITKNPKITLKELTEKLKINMELHLSK